MAEKDVDVIQYLLEIEGEVSNLINEERKNADAKIAKAKAEADAKFKDEFSTITAKIDKDEEKQKNSIVEKHNNLINSYKETLASSEKDAEAFNNLFEQYLKA